MCVYMCMKASSSNLKCNKWGCEAVTKNPRIKPRNTNVVLKGRHSLLQRWMHGG